jgi:glycosyltransferase involved in cell wall biosynthesis
MSRPGVSVIICCHNGARRLPETVRHLALQQVPSSIPWEFILVDNASTDSSVSVTEAVWYSHKPNSRLRIVQEGQLGLSYARARGFAEASFEYVIMCDDDNWLRPDYVRIAFAIMEDKKRIGALGGFGRLVFEDKPEVWIENSGIFAAGEQGKTSGRVKLCRVYGAGCVIRKSAYEKLKDVGFKSLLTDRKGSDLSSGGDHELCYALSIMGYSIWYDDRLKFDHFITRERLTWKYFIRYAKESAACFEVLTSYKMVALDINSYRFSFVVLARDFFYCLRRFIKISLQRIFTRKDTVAAKLLYFKFVILRHKVVSYLLRFDEMIKYHNEILKFKQACVQARLIAKPELKSNSWFATFSLKLFRQLQ